MTLLLSIIIPLHPKEQDYWNLLESLSQFPKETTEILVTVSGSHAEIVPTDEKEPERLLLFSHQECADVVVIPIRPSGFVYV